MLSRLKAILVDFFQQADLVLLSLCCISTLFGMVLIFSATRYLESNKFVIVQGVAMLLGICLYILFSMVDLEVLLKRWRWILAFNVLFILLLLTPFGASEGGNTLLLAKQLEWLREEKRDLKSLPAAVMVGGHAVGLCGLYFAVSGDMGNGLVFLFIFVCMAFVAGFALRWFALLFAGGGAAVTAAYMLDLMPDYMQGRFRALFDHSYDPLGVGWHQNRSLLTLGAGGMFGQGYLHGTQTQSDSSWSLPGRHTDFIFSVCGEELGMVGCLAVIGLLAAIIVRVLIVAKRAQTPFYCYVCVGMAAMLIFQTLINVGMCLFIMPTIGITLPFFSYGGSSIVTLFAAMGVVSGIKKRSLSMRRPGKLR